MSKVLNNLSKWLYATILLFILYLVFVDTFDTEELITGAVLAGIVSLFTYNLFSTRGLANLTPKKIFCSIVYFFYLFWEIILANLDVARRVIDPKLPINQV